jgi:Arc/MetJ-type ribon-helix-helix transcriptional regulator
MPLKSEGFKGLSLNAAVIEEVEEYINQTNCYKSVAEFVNETIRLRLDTLKKPTKTEPKIPC